MGILSIASGTSGSWAYLTHFHFQYLYRDTLPIGLLFYDKLFLDCDLQNLSWTGIDRWRLEELGETWPTEVETKAHETSFPEMALKEYLDHNPRVFAAIRKRLEYVRTTDSKDNAFFKESFEIPLEAMKGSGKSGAPIFSTSVLERMHELWEAPNLAIGRKLDHQDLSNLVTIYQDIFITNFLSRNYSIAPLMTFAEMEVIKGLLDGPDVPLWREGEDMAFS